LETWRLIDLGKAEPYKAQTFYEAVAEAVHQGLSLNTLILVQPSEPYVCVGYHQDLSKEIDLDYIRSSGLPVIRRSQGGGATYLDSGQVFYQIVGKNSEVLPGNVDKLFEKLLGVTVEVYRELGVPAEFKPLNDVVVEGRKISGNGAGVHESVTILVGNIIMDLEYGLMARVLRVPDEKFRDKMANSMQEWVSTLERELGEAPSPEHIKEVYVEKFKDVLNVELERVEPTLEELMIFEEETKPRHTSEEWLYMESPAVKPGRSVKIAHEVKVLEVDHKAGKLIRLQVEAIGDKIFDVEITGDFFIIPKESIDHLEETLRDAQIEEKELTQKIEAFYEKYSPESPGVTPRDFVNAFMKLKSLL
jgi:lipoate-protein ligase A